MSFWLDAAAHGSGGFAAPLSLDRCTSCAGGLGFPCDLREKTSCSVLVWRVRLPAGRTLDQTIPSVDPAAMRWLAHDGLLGLDAGQLLFWRRRPRAPGRGLDSGRLGPATTHGFVLGQDEPLVRRWPSRRRLPTRKDTTHAARRCHARARRHGISHPFSFAPASVLGRWARRPGIPCVRRTTYILRRTDTRATSTKDRRRRLVRATSVCTFQEKEYASAAHTSICILLRIPAAWEQRQMPAVQAAVSASRRLSRRPERRRARGSPQHLETAGRPFWCLARPQLFLDRLRRAPVGAGESMGRHYAVRVHIHRRMGWRLCLSRAANCRLLARTWSFPLSCSAGR